MSFFGWSKPDMAMRYVHLAGSDVRNAMNNFYGLEIPEERITLTNCPICKIPLTDNIEICPQCNYSFIRKFTLDKEESARIKLMKLLSDLDFTKIMVEVIERGLDKMDEEKLE